MLSPPLILLSVNVDGHAQVISAPPASDSVRLKSSRHDRPTPQYRMIDLKAPDAFSAANAGLIEIWIILIS